MLVESLVREDYSIAIAKTVLPYILFSKIS